MLELGYGVPCHYKHQLNGTNQKNYKHQLNGTKQKKIKNKK